MSSILIRTEATGPWEEPKSFQYGLEADLQEILAEHPHLIPGVGTGAKACREFRSDAGNTDLVVVDVDGSITLVECKLASNRQIRREIVGQMFDYASRFWKMNIADFEGQWLARTKGSRAAKPLFSDSEEQNLRLREDLTGNLAEGRFRIVLAVDEINPDLKRMVEYLNSMAGPETVIIAVEYTRLITENVEILMPQTYGEEIAEAKIAADERQQRTWTVDEYRAWMAENDPANAEKFSHLIEVAQERGMPFVGSHVGSKGSIPAGGLRVRNESSGWIGTLYIYHYAGGKTTLELSFANKENRDAIRRIDPDLVASFLASLEQLAPFGTAADILRSSGFARRPNVTLSDLSKADIERLVSALDGLKAESAPAPNVGTGMSD